MYYIHIPFCKRFCAYCDFYSTTGWQKADLLFEAMEREIQNAPFRPEGGSIYFGGGTPSLFPARRYANFIALLKPYLQPDAEITLEANPEDLNPAYLSELGKTGVNRLSIGIQSFCDSHLKQMHRRHTAESAVAAVREARKQGFSNLSIDLIFGFPGLNTAQWQANLRQAIALNPNHISTYQLSLEPGSAWGRLAAAGRMALPPEDDCAAHYRMAQESLAAAGYMQYEISNFCLPGYASRHNSGYWSGLTYLGIGPAAHSYNGQQRWWNTANNATYLKSIKEKGVPQRKHETLSFTDRANERIMLSLRTTAGMDLKAFALDFGADTAHTLLQQATPALLGGHLIKKAERLYIPPSFFFIADAVIAPLFLRPQKSHLQKHA